MRCPALLQSVSCHRPSLGSISIPNLELERGSFTVLHGPRSAGRVLLWRILGLLEQPDSGDVFICGQSATSLPPAQIEEIRNRHCGYVFESPFLLPSLSLIENLAMPLFKLGHLSPEDARKRAEELLDFISLRELSQSPTQDLTEPQQWCASVARALANHPSLLLVEYPDKQLPSDFLPTAARLLEAASQRWELAVVATASVSLPGATRLQFPPPESSFPAAP